MKRYHASICIVLLIVLAGCSSHFNDDDIIFRVEEGGEPKLIVTNQTGFDLVDLSYELSYAVENENDEEVLYPENDFTIKDAEQKEFSLPSTDDSNLDLNKLVVRLKGDVKTSLFKKVPFGISGSLSGLVER
ncbi:hypothetical protein [Gracilibacillus salinarum]|uniref:Lipoprotein n=1 Tax=Gracilibacillus salinarum TaxID=2932255 RepID=A0ABY4GSC3_9BACI|nr:hypothetical protein [Gracilibacillus salinarum]UOQ87169.1 hypothetical protein MUN87_09920 [Gracilibacillus salinarum]